MTFTGPFPFGRLYSLHYAYTDSSSTLAACNITVTAKCQPTISQPDPANETTETFTFSYQPEGPHVPNESFIKGFPPSDNGVCTSYAFEANGVNGDGVDLVIDEVLCNSY